MKITIDTKEDSHEEIKKLIRLLSSLISEESFTNQSNVFDNQSPDLGQNMGQNVLGMFDDKNQVSTVNQTEQSEKKEEDLDIPDLEEYY